MSPFSSRPTGTTGALTPMEGMTIHDGWRIGCAKASRAVVDVSPATVSTVVAELTAAGGFPSVVTIASGSPAIPFGTFESPPMKKLVKTKRLATTKSVKRGA